MGSSPSDSPSWSLARRPPSSHPNTRHCLEIQVTLMEELGAVHPPSHSWMAPLVEDILHNVRTSLTKAVVTGPGKGSSFLWKTFTGRGPNHRQGQRCHIPTHQSGSMDWETNLPFH